MKPRHWLLIPLALAVGVAGVIWGGKNTYVSMTNRSPVVTTCEQFEARPPDALWLRLRDCILDFDHMGVETSTSTSTSTYGGETVTAVYLPLRSPSLPSSDPAKLILAIEDGPMLELGRRFGGARDGIDDWVRYARDRGIDGVVELALDRSERKKKRMREIGLHAEDGAAIVAYGAAPRPLALAIAALVIGLGALGWLVWRLWPAKPAVDLPRAQIVQT